VSSEELEKEDRDDVKTDSFLYYSTISHPKQNNKNYKGIPSFHTGYSLSQQTIILLLSTPHKIRIYRLFQKVSPPIMFILTYSYNTLSNTSHYILV